MRQSSPTFCSACSLVPLFHVGLSSFPRPGNSLYVGAWRPARGCAFLDGEGRVNCEVKLCFTVESAWHVRTSRIEGSPAFPLSLSLSQTLTLTLPHSSSSRSALTLTLSHLPSLSLSLSVGVKLTDDEWIERISVSSCHNESMPKFRHIMQLGSHVSRNPEITKMDSPRGNRDGSGWANLREPMKAGPTR